MSIFDLKIIYLVVMLYFEAYKFQHARESDDSLPVVL